MKKIPKFRLKHFDFNAVKNTFSGSAGYVHTQRILKFVV